MKLVKPLDLLDIEVGSTIVIDNVLFNVAHYDTETYEFSFERLLSHLSGNPFEIVVMADYQVKDNLNKISILEGVI